VPAGADVRLRVLNVDNTRIVELGVLGAPAAVIAIDGNPLPPFALRSWRLGPAMRADLLVRTPADGEELRLVDWFAPEPVTLARLHATGPARRSGSLAPLALPAGHIPEADLETAERLAFTFATGTEPPDLPLLTLPDGTTLDPADALCLADRTFWAINGRSWPTDAAGALPPPLATLGLGRSYLLTLSNTSRQSHPIHLHGHTFKVLGSNRRDLPVHHADTVILGPRERIDIALLADNPGDWMLHCHIIEHQDTGMMGIVRVRG
jgi:FtsP/CotA-like multicopper oxidase with cupredoxin domain